jgi:hypothetical protein
MRKGLDGSAPNAEAPGWVTRNVRDGTVRLASWVAGETKNCSDSVMKPPAMGETVTWVWF